MEEDRDYNIDYFLRLMYRELVNSGKLLKDKISENDFVDNWYEDFKAINNGEW